MGLNERRIISSWFLIEGTVSWVYSSPCLELLDRPLKVLLPLRIFNFFLVCQFLYQIFVLPASLQITSGFALLWPLAQANFAYVSAVWLPVGCNLNPSGRYTHANFPDFACAWRLSGFNLHAIGHCHCKAAVFFNNAGSLNIEIKKLIQIFKNWK